MKIIEALQEKSNRLRISDGYHWLVGNGDGGWIVYERKPSKRTRVLIETSDEDAAIETLLENSGG